MRWVTRERPKTDRIACPWLIRKFIDRDAEIVYVPKDDVLAYAGEHGAWSFDAPGAEFTHRDGKCTFEVLIDDFGLADPAAATPGPHRPWRGHRGRDRRDAAIRRPAGHRGGFHQRRSRRPEVAGDGIARLRRAVRLVSSAGRSLKARGRRAELGPVRPAPPQPG
jgi:Chromate resistance exported protein